MSALVPDMQKPQWVQIRLRTSAIASEKVGVAFGIPSSLPDRKLAIHLGLMSQQGHPGEQAHQNRCCSSNGFIRPLALGFHAQMNAHFLESDFDLPTANKPLQDLQRASRLIRTP